MKRHMTITCQSMLLGAVLLSCGIVRSRSDAEQGELDWRIALFLKYISDSITRNIRPMKFAPELTAA